MYCLCALFSLCCLMCSCMPSIGACKAAPFTSDAGQTGRKTRRQQSPFCALCSALLLHESKTSQAESAPWVHARCPPAEKMVVARTLCCLLFSGVPPTPPVENAVSSDLVCIRAYCWTTNRRHASREKAMVATYGVCYSEAHLRDAQTLLDEDTLLGRRWWAGWQRSGQQQSRPCRACWCGMVPRTASCTPLTYLSSPSCTLAECCSASCWPSTNPSLRSPLAT